MNDFQWKLVYYNSTTYTDRDGPMHESPDRGALFVVQPGKDQEIVGINAAWIMWRRDLEEWRECGDDGFQDHASMFGHLVGCWRHTLWDGKRNFMDLWALARKELGQ